MAGASLFRVGDDVEFWRVLVHLSILVLLVIALERGLHELEYRLKRSPKYKEMLSKAYRELMILGFVGLAIKISKELVLVDADSAGFVAFNVADLTIFILALALILQALCVFLRLRQYNRRISCAELVSTTDLVGAVLAHDDANASAKRCSRLVVCTWFCSGSTSSATTSSDGASKSLSLSHSQRHCAEVVEMRVLRHIFLHRYGLPELFPFSKYISQAQDSQITHMLDVEISTWILLLVVAWGLEGAMELVRRAQNDLEPHAFTTVFVLFAWALVALHIAVASYFDLCLRKLLRSAGYSTTHSEMLACLKRIALEEADAWHHERATDALEVMRQVQEREEARQLRRKRKRHHVIESDTGLQLLATCYRHVRTHVRQWTHSTPELSRCDDPAMSIESTNTYAGCRPVQLLRQKSLAPVEMRWFSRKAWHFIVMFLLMLNGFYLALLLQCILYRLGTVYDEFGWFRTLLIPLPIALNMLLLQPRIFRSFMIVCSIFRVHTKALTEVISHFREVVELRSEFVTSLSDAMSARSLTPADLQRALATHDPRSTGRIEIEKLRLVLRSFGLQLSHAHFHSVAKMLFTIKDMRLEYAQVLRLLSVMNHDSNNSNSNNNNTGAPLIHPLQHQLILTDDMALTPLPLTIDATLPSDNTQSSGGFYDPAILSRRGRLARNDSQLHGASSRAIRCLYHIESMEFDVVDDASLATHYVRM